MSEKRMIENANKVAYLVKTYPEKTIQPTYEGGKETDPGLMGLLAMPPIEINTAFWYAEDAGWITKPDATGKITMLKEPEVWNFGEELEGLKGMLVFAFGRMAKREEDLEEQYVTNWLMGFPSHDVLVALSQLKDDHVLATYTLTDPKDLKSTYTFYTLYENGEQMWGRKSFKEEPTGEEVPDESDGDVAGSEAPDEQ